MSIDDIEQTGADDELFAGLHRSVAGATMTTSAADVVALGRRTRNRHRVAAAGIGTSMAALVAAIGVLAPSAGTGRGAVIQDAGFRVQKGTDGSVDVTVYDSFNPDLIGAALTAAGIKHDVQVVHLPADWNWSWSTPPDCAANPGVKVDPRVIKAGHEAATPRVKITTGNDGTYFVFPVPPAGDVVAVVRFYSHDPVTGPDEGPWLNGFAVMTGMPGKCVPVPARSAHAAGITVPISP